MYGVFVGGLGETSEAEVRETFAKFGEIESVKIIKEGVGQPKGYGFVNFTSEESRENALRAKDEMENHSWFVRKGHTSLAKDQVVSVHISGFPEGWSRVNIKEFAASHTETEVLNVMQSGTKTTICFRKSDIQKAISSLNGAQIDGRTLVVQAATPKSDRKNITFSAILYELAIQNGIAPLLDQQQFYLLEKSLRTLYVGNIAPNVTELEIANVFQEYGPLEDVSLVLNLETGEHRGFAFVVFETHDTCGDVLTADKFHSINGHIVKVQNSKPPKAVADLARQAGLNDMEGHRTHLLEQLLSAAKQVLACQQTMPMSTNNTYLDPTSNVVYVQTNGGGVQPAQVQHVNGGVVSRNKVPPLKPTPAYTAVSSVLGYQAQYQPMMGNNQYMVAPQMRQHMSVVPMQTQLGQFGIQQVQPQMMQQPGINVANFHALQQHQLAMQYMNPQQQFIQPQNQFASFPPNQNQIPLQAFQGQRVQVVPNAPSLSNVQVQAPVSQVPQNVQQTQMDGQSAGNPNSENGNKNPGSPTPSATIGGVMQTSIPPPAPLQMSPQMLPSTHMPHMIPNQQTTNTSQMLLQNSFFQPSMIQNPAFMNGTPANVNPQFFPSAAPPPPTNAAILQQQQQQQQQHLFPNGNSTFLVQQQQNPQIVNQQSASAPPKTKPTQNRFAPY